MAKAWDVHGLERGLTFREAAGRVILTRWHEMMSYKEGTLLGEDIEELHAMRVSSRRLRAAMDAFEGAFPARKYRPFIREVKRITDVLGEARDLDVAVERLEGLMDTLQLDERPGVQGLVSRYRSERRAENPKIAELFRTLEEERFERSLERFVAKHTGVRRKDLVFPTAEEG